MKKLVAYPILTIITFFLILILNNCLFSINNTPENTGKDNVMIIKPQTYKLKDGINNIFAVPKNNSVCTNSIGNSLTLIEIDKNRIKYTTLLKDFLRNVDAGEFHFFPVFSEHIFCYAQRRMIMFFDIKNVKYNSHLLCNTFEEIISKASIAHDKTFFIEIKQFSGNPEKVGSDPIYILRKYGIDFDNVAFIQEKKLSTDESYFTNGKNIFIADNKGITVYNLDLSMIQHPLSEVYKNKNSEFKISVFELIVHPILPFSVIAEEEEGTFLVEWSNTLNKSPIFPINSGLFEFSPDHNWLIYWQIEEEESSLYGMKVNPTVRGFLEPPIYFGTFTNIPDKNARTWIPDPISYVVIDTDKQELVVWNLE